MERVGRVRVERDARQVGPILRSAEHVLRRVRRGPKYHRRLERLPVAVRGARLDDPESEFDGRDLIQGRLLLLLLLERRGGRARGARLVELGGEAGGPRAPCAARGPRAELLLRRRRGPVRTISTRGRPSCCLSCGLFRTLRRRTPREAAQARDGLGLGAALLDPRRPRRRLEARLGPRGPPPVLGSRPDIRANRAHDDGRRVRREPARRRRGRRRPAFFCLWGRSFQMPRASSFVA
mmetsp:Transcript_10187/g.41258  ORF Transcript_10187/g.41258 Transcript_10187/m.41258 type:complete len:237 (+) Transcript_10187:2235-2945(+)